MAIIKAVVLKSKEGKEGKNKVRISVAHNGETRYIVTDIILNSSKEFKNGAVVKRPDAAIINVKIRKLLQRYQSVLDELEYIEGLTCPELVFQIKNAGSDNHRTLQSICDEYLENNKMCQSTATGYRTIWNVIKKNLGDKLLVEHVNRNTVIGLDKYLNKRGLKDTTKRNYLVFLKILLNYAQRFGYVQYKVHPFTGYELPQMEVREAWLSVDEVRRIRDLKTTKKNIKKCRDFFMLSYYLGGINITDLLDIDFNEQNDVLKYIRKKTAEKPKLNKYVEFRIPEEAKVIISKYKGADGRLSVSPNQRKYHLCGFLRCNMSKIAELTQIKKLIYYSARKSFSQHALELGVDTRTIDYILGHRVDKASISLYHYITVTPQMATEAVRKVLDNLK